MRRYPPLTDDELRQLYQQNPTPECRRLLWEIDRLQSVIAQQLDFLAVIDGAALRPDQRTRHETLLEQAHDEPYMARRQRERSERILKDPDPAVLGNSMVEPFIGPPERWQFEARRRGESKRKWRR